MATKVMKSIAALFLCAVAAMCGSCASSPQPSTPAQPRQDKWSGPFFFIQMTDPQLGMYDDNKSFARETALFEKAISEANRLRPAFVVITGDLVNQDSNKSQEDEFLRIAAKLNKDIPLYLVAGNHDVQKIPTNETLAHYRARFGEDWYSFDHGGCHLIVLDSTLMGWPAGAPEDAARQDKWLKDDLAAAGAAKPTHIIVFQHHAPFLKDIDEKDGYSNFPLAMRKDFLATLNRGGVDCMFVGHWHGNLVKEFGGLQIVTTSAVGKPAHEDASGFRIVKVFPGKIEHQYYELDKMPERITLEQHTQPAAARN